MATKKSYKCSNAATALLTMQTVRSVKMVDTGKKYEFYATLPDGQEVFLKGAARPYTHCHIYYGKINGNISSDRIGAYVRTLNSSDPGKFEVKYYGLHKTLIIEQA